MNTSASPALIVLLTALSLSTAAAPTSTPTKPTPTAAEQTLAQTQALFRAGQATGEDVLQAQTAVDEGHVQAASAQQKTAAEIDALQSVANDREQLVTLITARYQAGVVTQSEVNAAQIVLAEARIRLETGRLVMLREAALATATARYRAGVATQAEVQTAQTALDHARAQLAGLDQ